MGEGGPGGGPVDVDGVKGVGGVEVGDDWWLGAGLVGFEESLLDLNKFLFICDK